MPDDLTDTLRYYDEHAVEYRDVNAGDDMSEEYARFLVHLPPGGHILDAGCGPGRDARAFRERGYRVTAMDGSAAMVALATACLGHEVLHMRFQDIAWREEFDGIWASASLLHVPSAEMTNVLGRLARALRPAGVLFMSFRSGEEEGVFGGRYFSNYTAAGLREVVAGQPDLVLRDMWDKPDTRPHHLGMPWLYAIVQRQAPA